ncbi:hypothetical protein HK105_206834 [Polyrhizophydium stewartii]|uniref:DNA-directed RNA polymerase III subunit RPC9 n=1 Tax=Polyrhizophydium stewartii TaxID=2732419 RepID=A0ABR4N2E6_9FUNG|nr:hypothetical protein HK105_006342 [Polyrhizophydium stewartii]
MEVVTEQAALLSNYEVLTLLRANSQPKTRSKAQALQDLRTIEYETIKYLEALPCGSQSQEQIQAFLSAIKTWNLSKGEKLMLLNLRPISAVELNTVIEECSSRFTDEQQAEILQILDETLPYTRPAPPQPMAE